MKTMKARSIVLYCGQPPPMREGVTLLLRVNGEYLTAKADFGGYTTRQGRYISPQDIDEYAVLTE